MSIADVATRAPASAGGGEWAGHWPLPVVGMLGLSAGAIFAYSSGVFMEPMIAAFGWSRTAFSFAFMLQMLLGLVAMPVVGRLVDRFGPRRVALGGAAPFIATISLLSLANGTVGQWWLLCALVAAGQAFVAQTVWIAATIERFRASRGLAMAIVLAGLGLGSLVWPVLAAFYIDRIGWRLAYPALALTWGVIVLPLVFGFFHGAPDRGGAARRTAAPRFGRELRSRSFLMLVLAGGLFASAYYGLVVHLVSILRGRGLSLQSASAMAGLVGLFAIGGRLATGLILDRFPVRPTGVAIFLLPVAVAGLLLTGTSSGPVLVAAVALLGLATGAELDLVTFIAARRFPADVFGSVYAVLVSLLAVSASTGPLLGGALFDRFGSYVPFLAVIVPMALACAILMATMPLSARETAARP